MIYNQTMNYQVVDRNATITIKVTEFHQNSDDKTTYNLWDYNYSPTKETYRTFFDSYYKTISPPNVVTQEIFEQNSIERLVDLDRRFPFTGSLEKRKETITNFDPDPSLSAINYDSIESRQFSDTTLSVLVGIKIRSEVEDLVTNQDYCSDDIVSKDEILIDSIGQGFWQIGDKITIELTSNTFAVLCDEQNIPRIAGPVTISAKAVDTLTKHLPQFSIRNSQFNNVLEFSGNQTTTNVLTGGAITSSIEKNYLQFYTGNVANASTDCIGDINDPNALCTKTDEVANNLPTIPEL